MTDTLATTREAPNTEYVYPNYWEPMTQNISNYAANLPGQVQNTYDNWFSQDLSASFNPNLNTAFQTAGQANPWTPNVQGALTGLQQSYQPLAQQATQYDPTQLQQYLNPYTQDAANATVNAANRNLNENVLPAVNSSFAGQGQFGSTRNADFTNRAVRDNQQTLTDALGKLNYGAYQNANQTYSDWANKAAQGAAGQLNFANTQASLAGAGSALDQQSLNNLMTTGQYQQTQEQANIDRTYQDWLNQQKYPTTMMGALGQMAGQMSPAVKPNVYTASAPVDALTKALGAAQIMSSGLADSDIQSLLASFTG